MSERLPDCSTCRLTRSTAYFLLALAVVDVAIRLLLGSRVIRDGEFVRLVRLEPPGDSYGLRPSVQSIEAECAGTNPAPTNGCGAAAPPSVRGGRPPIRYYCQKYAPERRHGRGPRSSASSGG